LRPAIVVALFDRLVTRILVPTRSEGPWLFVALCVFWGGNWLATKGLVTNAPPFASAAARALLCGALMLALAGPAEARKLVARAPLAVVAIGLLTSTICNGAIYWGVTRVSTGLAAIVNNALTPIGLLVFGVLLGEESLSRRRVAGIALAQEPKQILSRLQLRLQLLIALRRLPLGVEFLQLPGQLLQNIVRAREILARVV